MAQSNRMGQCCESKSKGPPQKRSILFTRFRAHKPKRSKRLERKVVYLVLFLFLAGNAISQLGCTDPQAINFNGDATTNDGSCLYEPTNYAPTGISNLASPLLAENSGVIALNESLWVLNDGGNNTSLYELDTLGNFLREVVVYNVQNIDWESLAENDTHVFVGDFGNNSGTRLDLSIIKIEKQQLLNSTQDSVPGFEMQFSYADQIDFSGPVNGHNYDCEAFFAFDDSLFLFSKNWQDNLVKKYALPNEWQGTYITAASEVFNIEGMVTGASIDKNSGNISLLAYIDNELGIYNSFIYMLWDYTDNGFFSGNKRRIDIGSMFTLGQTEGIVMNAGHRGFITSEEINNIITIPPMLFSYDFYDYLTNEQVGLVDHKTHAKPTLYPNPVEDKLYSKINGVYEIYGWPSGVKFKEGIYNGKGIDLNLLAPGMYIYRVGQSSFYFLKM